MKEKLQRLSFYSREELLEYAEFVNKIIVLVIKDFVLQKSNRFS